ncbi:MAG: hypothetical protein QXY40_00950 [Candidatus Methanomethylicia archaeon]
MSRNCRVIIVSILAVLLLQLHLNVSASSIQVVEGNGWRIVKTNDLTVMFTSNGSRPMFIWWCNDSSNTKYLVDFVGLWEYFVVNSTPSPFRRIHVANTTNINVTLVKPVIDEFIGLSICINNIINIIDQYEEVGVSIEDFKNQVVAIMFKIDNIIQDVELYNKSLTTLRDSIRSLKIKYRSFDPYIYVKQKTISEILFNLDKLLLILSDMASLNLTAISLYIREVDERTNRLNSLINDLKNQSIDLSKYIDDLIENEYCSSCRNVMNSTRNDCLILLYSLISKFNDLNISIEKFNIYVETFMNKVDLDRELLILSNLLATITPIMDSLDSSCKSIVERVKECLEGGIENYLKCRVLLVSNLVELKSRLLVLRKNINSRISGIIENVNQIMEFTHPPFLSFQECEWSLMDLEYIPSRSSEATGLAFTYMLKSAPLRFGFTEGNIMIRCRLYTFPVVERINGLKYNVSKAELKIDLIVQNWIWITPTIRDMVTQAVDRRVNTSINLFSALALWVNLASINMTRIRNVWHGQYGSDLSASDTILLKDLNLSIDINAEAENEVEIKVGKLPVKFNFISRDRMLKGFFKFMGEAIVRYPNGTYNITNVYASYLEAPGFLKLYICYPYFNDGMLEHDPSLGVEVEEEQPIAEISIPIASRLKPYIAPIEVKLLTQPVSSTPSPLVTSPTTTFPTLEVIATILILIIIIAFLVVLLGRSRST